MSLANITTRPRADAGLQIAEVRWRCRLEHPTRTVGTLDDRVDLRGVDGPQTFGIPFDLLTFGSRAFAGPHCKITQQDGLGKGTGVIREIRRGCRPPLD